MRKDLPYEVRNRIRIERLVVSRFVKDALRAGHRLAVSYERGYDLDEMLIGSTNYRKIMEAAFAGDECHIFVQYKTGPTVTKGVVMSKGWVYFVFGNGGWDVISDYTVNLEKLLEGAEEVARKYE